MSDGDTDAALGTYPNFTKLAPAAEIVIGADSALDGKPCLGVFSLQLGLTANFSEPSFHLCNSRFIYVSLLISLAGRRIFRVTAGNSSYTKKKNEMVTLVIGISHFSAHRR